MRSIIRHFATEAHIMEWFALLVTCTASVFAGYLVLLMCEKQWRFRRQIITRYQRLDLFTGKIDLLETRDFEKSILALQSDGYEMSSLQEIKTLFDHHKSMPDKLYVVLHITDEYHPHNLMVQQLALEKARIFFYKRLDITG